MEVTVTATKLKIDTDTYVCRFDGRDIIKAEAYGGPQPGGSKTQNSWGVRLTLTGDAREVVEGGYFDISFAGGNVTNQPTWVNSKAGADQAVADISVMIRSSSGGGGGGQVDSIVPGDGIDVDATDPVNPIVSVKVDGVTIGFNGSGELEINEIPVGNTLFVDAVNGNDSTAEPDNLAKPFLTMAAAKAASGAGDVIEVGPGTYPETTNIWKDGVSWYFRDNTVLSVTINDAGVGGTCAIDGRGDFTSSGSQVVDLTGTSTLSIKCKRIGPLGFTELWCAVDGGSNVTIEADHIDGVASVSDGLVNHTSITATGGASVTGGSDGKAYIHVETSITNGYFYTVDPDGDHLIEVDCPNIFADEISSSGGTIRFMSSVIVAQYAGFDSGLTEFINCDIVTLNGIQLIDYLSNSRSLRLIRSSVGSISDNGSSPIEVSGSNPVFIHLEESVIVALGSNDSITSVNPITITTYGSAINNALGSGITSEGDLFYDQGGPSGGQVATANADGTWSWDAAPSGGITQLTGDGTAGPGSGSQALTLATVNSNVGSFGSATESLTITANAKGLVTAVSAQTVTPAVGSITGLGTGVSSALSNNADTASGLVTQTGGDARYVPLSTIWTSYSPGSPPSNNTTTAADIDSTANIAIPSTGLWEIVYSGNYTSAATTTGAGFGLRASGLTSDFVAVETMVDCSFYDRGTFQFFTLGNCWASATSRSTYVGGNHFVIIAKINVTGTGTIIPTFVSEVAGSAITVNSLKGYAKLI